jgi:hypothetical protein
MEWLTRTLPNWLAEWLQVYAARFFRVQLRVMLRALLLGVTNTLLLLGLPLTLSIGSQSIWNARYHLTPTQQAQVERWASVSQLVAYLEDVPPVVPLVLWYKENNLKAENPNNCEGLMGLHTAVRSGAHPCFPAGPVGPWDVAYQLQLGARTFKEHCPDVHYTTTRPDTLKRCYLYYNAGSGSRTSPDDSAYVMNGYDAAHENMVHTDVQGRQYRLDAMGAWPVHLAIQAQLSLRRDPPAPLAILAPAMLAQEAVDRAWKLNREIRVNQRDVTPSPETSTLRCREPLVRDCLIAPHVEGDTAQGPTHSPLLIAPEHRSEVRCGLLPGVDLVPPKASIVLAPMAGTLRRYADGRGNLAVQIENEAWTVWLTGLRSYTAPEGPVDVEEAIGAIGGAGSRTPGVHYAVYDKVNAGFVDPVSFLPSNACPASD